MRALRPQRRSTIGGRIAAVGRTDSDYDRTLEAIGAVATVATHLFNGEERRRLQGQVDAAAKAIGKIVLTGLRPAQEFHVFEERRHAAGCGPGQVPLPGPRSADLLVGRTPGATQDPDAVGLVRGVQLVGSCP